MSNTTKPNSVFWIIGVLALVWNILGVLAYLAQAYMTDETLALMPQADQDFHNNLPAWVTAAYAIAVFSGLLGSIALLMRKKFAVYLFTLSLLGVLAQQTYVFFLQDYVVIGGAAMIGPIVIIVICFFLIWFSKAQKQNGVIT